MTKRVHYLLFIKQSLLKSRRSRNEGSSERSTSSIFILDKRLATKLTTACSFYFQWISGRASARTFPISLMLSFLQATRETASRTSGRTADESKGIASVTSYLVATAEADDFTKDCARSLEPVPYIFYLRTEPDIEIATEHDDEQVVAADLDRESVAGSYKRLFFNLADKPCKGGKPWILWQTAASHCEKSIRSIIELHRFFSWFLEFPVDLYLYITGLHSSEEEILSSLFLFNSKRKSCPQNVSLYILKT